ncbi:MAG: hypothetical protein ACIAQF_08100, partial [Phycisphaerales bacterium JB065]
RWVYRLGPYFDFAWAGTTHIGSRADLLEQRDQILAQPFGIQQWSYEVSVFPSFGINRRYIGGDYRRQDWIDQHYHVRRMADAFQASKLIAFASARFNVGSTRVDGYIEIDPPPVGARFDSDASTASPATAFGHVDLRYNTHAAVGWMDGHASTLDEQGITDRRNWSNPARKSGDVNWEP